MPARPYPLSFSSFLPSFRGNDRSLSPSSSFPRTRHFFQKTASFFFPPLLPVLLAAIKRQSTSSPLPTVAPPSVVPPSFSSVGTGQAGGFFFPPFPPPFSPGQGVQDRVFLLLFFSSTAVLPLSFRTSRLTNRVASPLCFCLRMEGRRCRRRHFSFLYDKRLLSRLLSLPSLLLGEM